MVHWCVRLMIPGCCMVWLVGAGDALRSEALESTPGWLHSETGLTENCEEAN